MASPWVGAGWYVGVGVRSYDGTMDDAAFKAALSRLRASRVYRERDLALGGVLAEERRTLRRGGRAATSLEDAWRALAPAEFASRAQVVGFARGVLRVRVADEGVRFALDRWLRSGGLAALVSASPVTLSHVRLIVP